MMAGVYQPAPPAALHNAVSAPEINAHCWTVLATRTGAHWQWRDERNKSTEAQQALRHASDANEIIIMHRRLGKGWELVARLSGPAWRRLQTRRG